MPFDLPRPYFWLGASADADQALAVPVEPASGLAPSGFDPSRKCSRCGHEIAKTASHMWCGCRTVPWAIQTEEDTE